MFLVSGYTRVEPRVPRVVLEACRNGSAAKASVRIYVGRCLSAPVWFLEVPSYGALSIHKTQNNSKAYIIWSLSPKTLET